MSNKSKDKPATNTTKTTWLNTKVTTDIMEATMIDLSKKGLGLPTRIALAGALLNVEN